MKKAVALLLFIPLLNSCLTTGAPHGHHAESIDPGNSKIKVGVSCQPHNKYFIVSGFEINDSIFISSDKMKGHENVMTEKKFLRINDTVKSFRLRMGDHNFHRNLLNDTIAVKIVKPDLSYKTYKFLIVKDSYIKN